MDPITLWIETKWAFLMSLVSQNIIPYFFELYSFVLFFLNIIPFSTVQSLSRVWLFCNAMDCSMPGFSVLHQLPELAQTHVLWVGDAIRPSHPLSSPSPAFSLSLMLSQLFASGGKSIGVSASASVLPMNIQDWFPLGWTGWISLLSKGLSSVFSNTTAQKHQLFSAQLSL